MNQLRALRLFRTILVASALILCVFTLLGRAGSPEKTVPENTPLERPIYHADPQHLWNRLHAALFIRVGPDGRAYGQDRLEPLLWPQSKHLLEERSHNRAVAVLNEFLDKNGKTLIVDPLRRALLQRDLWLVFNWLEGDHGSFADPPLNAETARAAQDRLRRLLAAAIGRLAPTAKEIQNLPDNYAAAVASGQFANTIDPEQPDNPYLPPDLFATDGPWVCVGRSDGITAPQHLREENTFTNSVFLVFLRLPAGRAATVGYLRQLLSFNQPLLVRNPEEADRRSFPFVPNPKLPQFPKGTELALVRRALLIDSSHRVVASPLTESVQLRIIHGNVPALTKQVFDDGLGSTPAAMRRASAWQSFQEARLSRSRLTAGRAGGLRIIGSDERDFKTGFVAHTWDEFEAPLAANQSFPQRSQRFTIKEQCFFCHSMPGVYSFNSFKDDFRFAMAQSNRTKDRPFPLSMMPVSDVAAATVRWKESRANWSALKKLLAE